MVSHSNPVIPTNMLKNRYLTGTEGFLTVPVMTSIFANQTFPDNWHRHNGAVGFDGLGEPFGAVAGDNPPVPGGKNSSGVYVNDTVDANVGFLSLDSIDCYFAD